MDPHAITMVGNAFGEALRLLTSFDAELIGIVGLSLQVSLGALFIAALIGLPFGAALALYEFPGRRSITVLLNALMGLPPVVVGLFVYLVLSRAGPLGFMELLFTPTAMVIAQTILITPIVAALTRQLTEPPAATISSVVFLPLSSARSHTATFAPSFANRRARYPQ